MVDTTKKYIVPCTHKDDFDKLSKNTVKCVCDVTLDKHGFVTCFPDNKNYDNMVFVDSYFAYLLYTNYITVKD